MHWLFIVIVVIFVISKCSGDKPKATPSPSYRPSPTVENASYAKASDVQEAEKFLAQIPEACSNTRATAAADGTITIRLLCNGNGKSMDGSVSIKNRIVTELK